MNANQSYPAAGEVIDGKYQVEQLLGEGGMGAVAKATHLLRRAPVALKFMSPNVIAVTGAVERFLNEGVAASQIESENVVHVFDVGKLPNGAPYLVMEYMEGRDLAVVIEREGNPGIEPTRAIYFIIQALRGLQVAHDAGIIHRDMKPSNCFVVNKEGEPDFVKLLDFGISKVGQGKSASLTQTNSALGTPLYMSPEQARSPRDVDLRSDLYSVGVILYELLTGRTPFSSESGEFTEILFKLFTQDPPPIRALRPELSPELAAAVHKALVRDPKERYASAAEFALALEPFADQRSARVLQRLRMHSTGGGAPKRKTLDAGSGAEPVAAFSKLVTGAAPARTNDLPGAPPRVQAETQRLPQGPQTTPLGQMGGAAPAYASGSGPAARVETAAEAVAATQFGGGEVAPAPVLSIATAGAEKGKQTDLGASRDTSVAVPHPPSKGTSPLAYVVPGLLLLVVGGIAIAKLTAKPPHPAADVTTTMTAEPPASVPVLPPPPVPTETPPTPTVLTAQRLLPDASVATTPTVPPVPKKDPTPAPHPSTGRTPRLGDLKIHE